ncbi:MAG: hypothetical protein MHM6MM_000985 [Cercozoa sp. M6MM]
MLTGRRVAHTARRCLRALCYMRVWQSFLRMRERTLATIAFCCVMVFVALNAAVFQAVHGWSYLDALVFVVSTLTTTGYGDVHPNDSVLARLLSILLVVLSLTLAAAALSLLVERFLIYSMRRHKDQKENYINLALLVCGFLLVGSIVFTLTEGWTFLDALYFSVMSIATVGYGDLVVTSTGGKIFVAIWLLLGTFVLAKVMARVANFVTVRRRKTLALLLHSDMVKQGSWRTFRRRMSTTSKEVRLKLPEEDSLSGIDDDNDGLRESDFILSMLLLTGATDNEEVESLRAQFAELDANRDGRVTSREFHDFRLRLGALALESDVNVPIGDTAVRPRPSAIASPQLPVQADSNAGSDREFPLLDSPELRAPDAPDLAANDNRNATSPFPFDLKQT